MAYVDEIRDLSLPVRFDVVMKQAQVFNSEAGIMPRTSFKASRAWVSKFMNRAGFSLCQHTSVCQKLPLVYYEETVLAFHRHFLKLGNTRIYFLSQIGNAGQTLVYFDMTSNMMVSLKRAGEVKLLTTGNEKLRSPFMLSYLADGTKLRQYIVFKTMAAQSRARRGGKQG